MSFIIDYEISFMSSKGYIMNFITLEAKCCSTNGFNFLLAKMVCKVLLVKSLLSMHPDYYKGRGYVPYNQLYQFRIAGFRL